MMRFRERSLDVETLDGCIDLAVELYRDLRSWDAEQLSEKLCIGDPGRAVLSDCIHRSRAFAFRASRSRSRRRETVIY